MPHKIIIEIELHDDADVSRAEDVVDMMLDAGTIQDEINDEAPLDVEDDDEDDAPATAVNARCYIDNTDARLAVARACARKGEHVAGTTCGECGIDFPEV